MNVLGPADLETLRSRVQQRERRQLNRPDLLRAAVLVPLFEENGQWTLLFAKRSQQVDTHVGQVAFPGGHVEDHDADIVATALREADEEVGLKPSQVEVLGLLDEVVSITEVHVTPVLGRVHGPFEAVLDREEVELIFTLSIAHLADPASITSTLRRQTPLGEINLPTFSGGPAPIWGLTGWMVRELLPLFEVR